MGFINCERILDLACGVGQWAVAMSGFNKKVYGIDLLDERIKIANFIKEKNNIKNIEFVSGKSENLPYKDDFFDVIFCYDSFVFMSPIIALNEIKRVLKNKGKLYLSVSGFGWYLNIFLKAISKLKIYQVVNFFLVIINGFLWNFFGFSISNRGIFFTRRKLIKFLKNNDFKLTKIDYEGKINVLNSNNSFRPVYKGKFWIFDSVFELICQK